MARGRVETFTGYFPALRYVKITCSLLRRKSGILPPKSGRMWVPTSKRVSEFAAIISPIAAAAKGIPISRVYTSFKPTSRIGLHTAVWRTLC